MFASKNDSRRSLIFLLHLGFLISGVDTVLLGQILPILSAKLSLSDEQASYFFIAQFSGSLVGTLLVQPIAKRLNFLSAVALGAAAMALGVFGLNAESWSFCLAAFFINGFGIGITLPSINMLTVELSSANVTSALNFLNFFWGIGAILCKPFVDFFGTRTSIMLPTAILSVSLLIVGGLIFSLPRAVEPQRDLAAETADEKPPIWSTSLAWAIALFNFIHVGFESGASGWITTYAARFPDRGAALAWLSPITLYFLFFLAGRGSAPLYSRFFRENTLLSAGLLVATGGMLILLLSESYFLLSFGAGVAGFGTATIFPTNTARFAKTFGASATRRATPLFICGTLGSTATTFLIGYISNRFQDLRVGMFVLLGSCVILLTLQTLLTLKMRRRRQVIGNG